MIGFEGVVSFSGNIEDYFRRLLRIVVEGLQPFLWSNRCLKCFIQCQWVVIDLFMGDFEVSLILEQFFVDEFVVKADNQACDETENKSNTH